MSIYDLEAAVDGIASEALKQENQGGLDALRRELGIAPAADAPVLESVAVAPPPAAAAAEPAPGPALDAVSARLAAGEPVGASELPPEAGPVPAVLDLGNGATAKIDLDALRRDLAGEAPAAGAESAPVTRQVSFEKGLEERQNLAARGHLYLQEYGVKPEQLKDVPQEYLARLAQARENPATSREIDRLNRNLEAGWEMPVPGGDPLVYHLAKTNALLRRVDTDPAALAQARDDMGAFKESLAADQRFLALPAEQRQLVVGAVVEARQRLAAAAADPQPRNLGLANEAWRTLRRHVEVGWVQAMAGTAMLLGADPEKGWAAEAAAGAEQRGREGDITPSARAERGGGMNANWMVMVGTEGTASIAENMLGGAAGATLAKGLGAGAKTAGVLREVGWIAPLAAQAGGGEFVNAYQQMQGREDLSPAEKRLRATGAAAIAAASEYVTEKIPYEVWGKKVFGEAPWERALSLRQQTLKGATKDFLLGGVTAWPVESFSEVLSDVGQKLADTVAGDTEIRDALQGDPAARQALADQLGDSIRTNFVATASTLFLGGMAEVHEKRMRNAGLMLATNGESLRAFGLEEPTVRQEVFAAATSLLAGADPKMMAKTIEGLKEQAVTVGASEVAQQMQTGAQVLERLAAARDAKGMPLGFGPKAAYDAALSVKPGQKVQALAYNLGDDQKPGMVMVVVDGDLKAVAALPDPATAKLVQTDIADQVEQMMAGQMAATRRGSAPVPAPKGTATPGATPAPAAPATARPPAAPAPVATPAKPENAATGSDGATTAAPAATRAEVTERAGLSPEAKAVVDQADTTRVLKLPGGPALPVVSFVPTGIEFKDGARIRHYEWEDIEDMFHPRTPEAAGQPAEAAQGPATIPGMTPAAKRAAASKGGVPVPAPASATGTPVIPLADQAPVYEAYGSADKANAKVSGRYAIVSAASLKTDAAGMQDRQADSRQRLENIEAIAANLNPARLGESASVAEGAPIVNPDGTLPAGNTRVQAIQRAYANDGYAAAREGYRQMVTDFAKRHGLEEQMQGIADPVLVRVNEKLTGFADAAELAANSNTPAVMRYSAHENMLRDAQAIQNNGALDQLEPTTDGTLKGAAAAPFVGMVGERNTDVDERMRRARNSLLGLLLQAGEPDQARRLALAQWFLEVLDDAHNPFRGLLQGLQRGVPVLVKSARSRPQYNLIPALGRALARVATAIQETGPDRPMKTVEEWLATPDMFDATPEATKELAALLLERQNADLLHDIFTKYAAAVAAYDPNTPSMFGDLSDADKVSVLKGAIEDVNRNEAKPKPGPSSLNAVRRRPARDTAAPKDAAAGAGRVPAPGNPADGPRTVEARGRQGGTDDAGKPQAKLSTADKAGNGNRMTRDAAAAAVSRILQHLPADRQNRVHVVETAEELPRDVLEQIGERGHELPAIEGVFVPDEDNSRDGEVWIVAAAHSTPDQTQRTMLHEMTHWGLVKMLGLGRAHALMNQIWRNGTADTRLLRIAERQNFDLLTAEGWTNAAEELLAETDTMAGQNPSVLTRLLAAMRQALRAIGFQVDFSDSDIRAIVHRARTAVALAQAEEKAAAEQAAKFSVAEPTGTRPNDPIKINGSVDLAQITAEMQREATEKLVPAPIRLMNGQHFGDPGDERGFGIAHIDIRHGEEIKQVGKTVPEFVWDILHTFTQIWRQPDGNYLLVRQGQNRRLAVVELRDRGAYYSVVTAFVPTIEKLTSAVSKGAKLVWRGRRPPLPAIGEQARPELLSGINTEAAARTSSGQTTKNIAGKPGKTTSGIADEGKAVAKEDIADYLNRQGVPDDQREKASTEIAEGLRKIAATSRQPYLSGLEPGGALPGNLPAAAVSRRGDVSVQRKGVSDTGDDTARRIASVLTGTNQNPEEWARSFAESQKGEILSLIHRHIKHTVPALNLRGIKIESARDFAALLMPLRSPWFETLKVAYLDENGRVLDFHSLTIGLVDRSQANSAIIMRDIPPGTRGILLAHNHPSGETSPSEQDVEFTRQAQKSIHMIGLSLIDHVITNGGKWCSMREVGLVDTTQPANQRNDESNLSQEEHRGPEAIPDMVSRAPWEAVPRENLRKLYDTKQFNQMLTVLRQSATQGGNPLVGHVIFLTPRHEVLSVKRFPLSDLADRENLLSRIAEIAAREGAVKIMLDLGSTPEQVARDHVKSIKTAMDAFGFQLLDSSTDEKPSFRNAGLLDSAEISDRSMRLSVASPTQAVLAAANRPTWRRLLGTLSNGLTWGEITGGVPAEINRLDWERAGHLQVEGRQANELAKRLEQLEKGLTEAQREQLYGLLTGDFTPDEATQFSGYADQDQMRQAVAAVQELRNRIDGLSQRLVDAGMLPGALALTIERNQGHYVVRAYEKYLNPDWTPKPDTTLAAEQFLRKEQQQRLDQYNRAIDRVILRYERPDARERLAEYARTGNDALLLEQSAEFQRNARRIRTLRNTLMREFTTGTIDTGIRDWSARIATLNQEKANLLAQVKTMPNESPDTRTYWNRIRYLQRKVEQLESRPETSSLRVAVTPEEIADIVRGELERLRIEGTREDPATASGQQYAGNRPDWRMIGNSLKRRKDIPDVIRQYWGEITDIAALAGLTMSRLGQMATAAEFQKRLAEVSPDGKPMFIRSQTARGDYIHRIPDTPSMGALAGMWVRDPGVYQFVLGAFEKQAVNRITRLYFTALAFPRTMKTAGNPATHMRNFLGNFLFAIASGEAFRPSYWIGWARALKMYWDLYKGNAVEWEKLAKLSAISSNLSAEELRAIYSEAFGNNQFMTPRGFLSKINKLAASGSKMVADLYALEDSIHKAALFYAKTSRGIPEAEAVRQLRRELPYYDMAPHWIRNASKWIPFLPDFMTFKAEAARVTANNWIDAIEAARQGRYVEAMAKMAGTILAQGLSVAGDYGGGWLLSKAFCAAAKALGLGDWEPLDEDDEKAVRGTLPAWQRFNSLILFRHNGTIYHIDLGYMTPYDIVGKAVMAATSLLPSTGAFLTGGIPPTSPKQDNIWTAIGQDVFGAPMALKAYAEFVTNSSTETGMDVRSDPSWYARSFLPQWAPTAMRLGEVIAAGEPLSNYSGELDTVGSLAAKMVQPLRVREVAPAELFAARSREIAEAIRNAKGEANKAIRLSTRNPETGASRQPESYALRETEKQQAILNQLAEIEATNLVWCGRQLGLSDQGDDPDSMPRLMKDSGWSSSDTDRFMMLDEPPQVAIPNP